MRSWVRVNSLRERSLCCFLVVRYTARFLFGALGVAEYFSYPVFVFVVFVLKAARRVVISHQCQDVATVVICHRTAMISSPEKVILRFRNPAGIVVTKRHAICFSTERDRSMGTFSIDGQWRGASTRH